MTARGRAIEALARLPGDAEDGVSPGTLGTDGAECGVGWIESAGLAIVDRELLAALVAAVRADDRAIQASCVDPDSTPAADADALALLMRAIALLDERGEG